MSIPQAPVNVQICTSQVGQIGRVRRGYRKKVLLQKNLTKNLAKKNPPQSDGFCKLLG